MLVQDPFRDFDSLFTRAAGRGSTPMPMDAYRRGSDVWVHVDLPGVSLDSIDVNVERSVLTVTAERNWQLEEDDRVYLSERSRGTFRRQVHLGEGLDPAGIEAAFPDGVLTLRIPVAEQAKPRKIEINSKPLAINVESTVSA